MKTGARCAEKLALHRQLTWFFYAMCSAMRFAFYRVINSTMDRPEGAAAYSYVRELAAHWWPVVVDDEGKKRSRPAARTIDDVSTFMDKYARHN